MRCPIRREIPVQAQPEGLHGKQSVCENIQEQMTEQSHGRIRMKCRRNYTSLKAQESKDSTRRSCQDFVSTVLSFPLGTASFDFSPSTHSREESGTLIIFECAHAGTCTTVSFLNTYICVYIVWICSDRLHSNASQKACFHSFLLGALH